MNKRVFSIVSKLFLCAFVTTNFCSGYAYSALPENLVENSLCLYFAKAEPGLIEVSKVSSSDISDSEYRINNNEIKNSIATYGSISEGSSPYKISLISVTSDNESFIIPKGFKTNSEKYIVTSIDDGAFSGRDKLKYVKLEHEDINNFTGQVADGAFDFSSAKNLEAIYVGLDISKYENNVKVKFDESSSNKVLHYIELSDKTIKITKGPFYTEDGVEFSFDDVIPNGYSGYSYKVM